jgi:hypothetical protein
MLLLAMAATGKPYCLQDPMTQLGRLRQANEANFEGSAVLLRSSAAGAPNSPACLSLSFRAFQHRAVRMATA